MKNGERMSLVDEVAVVEDVVVCLATAMGGLCCAGLRTIRARPRAAKHKRYAWTIHNQYQL